MVGVRFDPWQGGRMTPKKKKQKDFYLLPDNNIFSVTPAKKQKFFGSFFQKRTAFFLACAHKKTGPRSPRRPVFHRTPRRPGVTSRT
jgi:hypothetical protein